MPITRVQIKGATVYSPNFSSDYNNATTIPLSPAATAGNLLIAVFSIDKSSGTITPPSGWTVLGNRSGTSASILVVGKIAAGGETTVSANWATMQNGYGTIIAEYSGVDTNDPFGPISFPAYSDTARASMALGPLVAESAGTAVAVFNIDSMATTAEFSPTATGFPHVFTTPVTVGASGWPGAALAERSTELASGATQASTTFTWTTSDQVNGLMVLLNAGAAAIPSASAAGSWSVTGSAVGQSVAPLPVPQNLTAVAASDTRVDLSWNAAAGAASYDIERNGSIIVSSHPSTTYADTGLTPSTAYTYRVRAVS